MALELPGAPAEPAAPPDPAPDGEPVLTSATIAAVVAGAVLLLVKRANRQWDVLSPDELTGFQQWLTPAVILGLALEARRKVVPVAKALANRALDQAISYSAGLADGSAQGEPQVVPEHVVAQLKAQGVAEHLEEQRQKRREQRAAAAPAARKRKR